MLRGILRVYAKAAPLLVDLPDARAILVRQVERFETELIAAEARQAIRSGNFAEASARLRTLRGRQGGIAVRLAAFLAEWTPGLLAHAYRARRRWQGIA
jgi:hypothetical protein